MTKLNDILTKRVVSLFNARIEGIISNAYFNTLTGKLKYLEVIDDLGENDERIFDIQNIFNIGNDAIMVKNSEKFELKMTLDTKNLFTPMNKIVYNCSGEELGYVTNVEMTDKYALVKFFTSKEKEFTFKNIINISDNTILINESTTKICIANFKFRKKPIDNNVNIAQKVSILPIETEKIETEDITTEQKSINYVLNTDKPNPTRLLAKYDFLLGRQVLNNITNENNVVVIRKNTKINARVIEIACATTKIRELILNSK